MNATKPITFAAMLVRAQRRFDAVGQALPTTRQPGAVQPWPSRAAGAAARSAITGLTNLLAPQQQDTVAR